MLFYTYLMLLGPLADLYIFLWSKMPLLPLFSHLLARGPRIIIFILRAQILKRRPPSTPLYKILVRWVTDSQELGAQAPTPGMHSASSGGFLPLHLAHGPWDLPKPTNDKGSKHGVHSDMQLNPTCLLVVDA